MLPNVNHPNILFDPPTVPSARRLCQNVAVSPAASSPSRLQAWCHLSAMPPSLIAFTSSAIFPWNGLPFGRSHFTSARDKRPIDHALSSEWR